MIDQIRSHVTTAYTMLIFDFADLEGVNKAKILETIRCPLVELFDKQKNADRAKRLLKADFNKAVALFFHDYQSSTGFDYDRLAKKLDQNQKVFERHLGKPNIRYLRLLITFAGLAQEKKQRGLLVGVA